ncbi:MAG: ferrous iron transporter B [Lachnospiraceae bacterium]|nr:ferrous iron transporter B [Lachnospiraceae bacterium]
MKIALAGNPNSGKTTLFNALTGANQFVGNWPGVTVEKKEGKLKGHDGVTVVDLPGIYSLSPYTLEEIIARNFLIRENPDAILNIVDGTNLERNLYLTTQLTELGIPVVVAINMSDVVDKLGDEINTEQLGKELGCKVVTISALKGDGVKEAADAAVQAAHGEKTIPMHKFSGPVEHCLAHIEEALVHDMPLERQRWYAIKLFENDKEVLEELKPAPEKLAHIREDIAQVEKEIDDDADSIIINERYVYIGNIIQHVLKKKSEERQTLSDKIDAVVTNRILALPIFAIVMIIVYYVSVTTVGSWATDWANDGVFGDGFHLFGMGGGEFEEADGAFADAETVVNAFLDNAEENGADVEAVREALDTEAEGFDADAAVASLTAFAANVPADSEVSYLVEDEETLATEEATATGEDLAAAVEVYEQYGAEAPDPAAYGTWVPGIPVLAERGLDAIGCNDVLKGLVLDGIIAGVGAVLGFVPQIFVLFLFLAFLESCGYMARIAFIMDRIFRRFGLSGKSFIPILIGTGCGIPGIMASRTIENERDRRMTIITTTFIPCGAKLPFIAMVAGAIFGGAWWVAPAAYFIGIFAIVCSGIILKKTRVFAGDPAPFVMELPAYHMPTVGAVLRGMWERGWSFIKKAGTIILLSTIVIWFLTFFGFTPDGFRMLAEEEIEMSILANIGNALAWIFTPAGFGNWQATVASITGLVAKENIVGTMGILYSVGEGTVYQNMALTFTAASGLAFLVFNLLCAPCFAAMGAIKREMNSRKWFWIAIGYQCGFAYLAAIACYGIGSLFAGAFNVSSAVGIVIVAVFLFLLFRPAGKKVTGGLAAQES